MFTTEFASSRPAQSLQALKAAAARANLPSHKLRHSAAPAVLIIGVPLEVVSGILGHASIAITGDL